MILRTLLVLSPLLLAVLGLFAIFTIIRNEKEERTKNKQFALFGAFVTILIASLLLKVSFFYEWLDAIFILVLIFAGPIALLTTTKFKSKTSKVATYTLSLAAGAFILFFSFLIFTFGSPFFEGTEQQPSSNDIVKVYTRGGATAACNYEISRTVQRLLIFEREVSSETTLLTPDLPRCK